MHRPDHGRSTRLNTLGSPHPRRILSAFRRLNKIPEHVTPAHTICKYSDLEWAAHALVAERSFTWRQTGLRAVEIQLLGVSTYGICAILSVAPPGIVALLCTTAWAVQHMWTWTVDMRQCRDAQISRPVLAGLQAIGGFGSLPAAYALTLLTAPPVDQDGADLQDIGAKWLSTNLADDDVRETFMLLAAEFDGTADDLLTTSAFLQRT
jgi:hypothetical protein